MDTVFSFAIPRTPEHIDLAALVSAITDDLEAIESTLSVFRPDSEINRWSRGQLADDQLDAGTREVIAACDRLEMLTGGLFAARRDGRYDPTGYVKGWALARAAATLDGAGATSYCLNGGGDIIARGSGPHGVPWRVGVAHPYRAGELATIVTAIPGDVRPMAVATSGTSERGRHIVEPTCGWRPTRSAVTVVGHDIAFADAIATAALAAGRQGPGASIQLVQNLGMDAFGFDEDGRPWWTPGMADHALLPRRTSESPYARTLEKVS